MAVLLVKNSSILENTVKLIRNPLKWTSVARIFTVHTAESVLQHTVLIIHTAESVLQHTVFTIHTAVSILQHTVFTLHTAVCILQHTVFTIHTAVCILQHTVPYYPNRINRLKLWCTPAAGLVSPR